MCSAMEDPDVFASCHLIYIYIYILKSVYLVSKLLFKQVLFKKVKHWLLFLILFFQVSLLLLFFLRRDTLLPTRKKSRKLEKIKSK